MALYKYIAAKPGQNPEEMIIEGANEKEALAKLRLRGMIPVRFAGVEDAGKKRFGGKRADVYEFTRQLTPLLGANIPLEQSLAIISEGASDPVQKDFVNSLRQGLHEGKKFSELVRSFGSLFPDYYANLIESGEETGCLPEVAEELHKFMGESKEMRDFIVSSSIYPIVIFAVVMVVSVVLFCFTLTSGSGCGFPSKKAEMPVNQGFWAPSCQKKILAIPHEFGILIVT